MKPSMPVKNEITTRDNKMISKPDSPAPLAVRLLRLVFNREVIVYLFVGVLTTLVNIGVFTVLSHFLGHDRWWLSNAPAIFLAILFAYVCNRIFVFRSHGPILQELYRFFISRIAISLLFEYGAMFLLYNLLRLTALISFLQWEISVSKLLTQVFVVIGNYVLSKLFIFNRSKSA